MVPDIPNDFTETHFRDYLKQALEKYKVCGVASAIKSQDNVCVWRHDIDISPQRAVRIAEIEAEEGIQSTYYVQLRSFFYNFFETTVKNCITEIRKLGHEVGLHFDPSFYNDITPQNDAWKSRLTYETNLLQNELGEAIKSFSFHNPVGAGWHTLTITDVNGIYYSYHPLLSCLPYCSDSSGMWRHLSLQNALSDPSIQSLYVLTHPEWWTRSPLSIDEKILRAIDGKRNDSLKRWNDLLGSRPR